MNIEQLIRDSSWWRDAEGFHDRHYPAELHVTLADHLQAVLENLRSLLGLAPANGYGVALQRALREQGADPVEMLRILTPVALFHDIGKPREDKSATMPHPLSGKDEPRRHPLLAVQAGCELLPAELPNRALILSLLEEHDTAWGWYRQVQARGQRPSPRAWRALDRKLCAAAPGAGLRLLAVFKLVDTDGHADVGDVPWFIGEANGNVLDELGLRLPVPSAAEVVELDLLRGRR